MESTDFDTYNRIATRISAKELSTLLKVSSSLASTMDLTEVLQIAIESAVELIDLDSGAIYTLEDEILRLGATVPPLPSALPEELMRARLEDHPHIQQALLTKSPIYISDAREVTLSAAEKIIVDSRGLVSILYFPLLLKETAIGVFILGTVSATRQLTANEIDLSYILSFQVALAIANAQLYKRAQEAITGITQAYDATLVGWSRMLDMRDHVTDEHTHRVADLTVKLAARMGVPDSEMGDIRRGALLHDIGKMGIPDAILQKPAALDETERAIMQTHPEKAYQILLQIDYLRPAIHIPYAHHEKWDGTGYPRGLKREEIPLVARIFTVIDVYDALTSDRPYRSAWSKDEALRYIQEQSGKHFFPDVVQVFAQMVRESEP
jgi:putative nucleotidyltransferase with HDIG domain